MKKQLETMTEIVENLLSQVNEGAITLSQDQIDELQKEVSDSKKIIRSGISIYWQTDDVIERAKEIDEDNPVIISEEEAISILKEIDHNHDANIGICWDVIDQAIIDFKEKREQEIIIPVDILKVFDVDELSLSKNLRDLILDQEPTYRDTVLKEHLYNLETLLDAIKEQEVNPTEDVRDELDKLYRSMSVKDAAYIRIRTS